MNNIKTLFCFVLSFLLLQSCMVDQKSQLIVHNAQIYTVNPDQPNAEAISIVNGVIDRVGSNADILQSAQANATIIDANQHFVMPGFIEGHGHFSGLGASLQNLNFLTSANWDEIVSMVEEKAKTLKEGEWIEGRGWHQEKWDEAPHDHEHGYPTHYILSEISKNNPVILYHASGHALFANKKAMELAGISKETNDPEGGAIVRNAQGDPIGVFEERAMNLIYDSYQDYLETLPEEDKTKKWHEAIQLASQECLQKGITSFQDAGSKTFELERYQALAENGQLPIRLWAMLRHRLSELKDINLSSYRMKDAGQSHFTCNAIKTEVDGALGSYGAWLLDDYNDKADFVGQNTTPIEEVVSIAQIAQENDMQLCVHAIGDKANQVVLDLIEKQIEAGLMQDHRWRIEHAQHLDTADIPRFAELGVIASMQAIHCTSDAPFVAKRLGAERSAYGAYPWRSLLDAGAIVTNGTDAPVEDVDPLASYYASITRKRIDNGMTFYTEQCMTREEAIEAYTIQNAYAVFEESMKGSLEVGKLGDIVILSENLYSCTEEQVLDTEVLYTIVGGKVLFEKNPLLIQ